MKMDDEISGLMEFFKALSDANRLKIVGVLAQGEYSVEQMAEMLKLRPSTVSHHLAKLAAAGLVRSRSESYYNIYRLQTEKLEEMFRKILSCDTIPAIITDVDMDAYDRKIINTFCDNEGRIHQFPAQRKKLEVLLRHVVKDFKPGKHYTEKQVNEKLSFYSDDTATLRRGLIDHGIMKREGGGGEYWVPEN